jgi:hypothetical protein
MYKKILNFWNLFPTEIVVLMAFLLPVVFLPFQYLDLLSTKTSLFLLGLFLALFFWSINALKKNAFKFPKNFLSLSLVLIPVTYFVSALFSGNLAIALLGKDFGYDSVIVFTSLFVFLFLVINNFQNEKKALYLKTSVFISLAIIFIFNLIRILFGQFIPNFNFFFEASSNTVGQWYDLGIVAGLGAVMAIVALELFKFTQKTRALLVAFLVLSLFTLLLSGFTTAWIILGIFSIVIFVYVFSLRKSQDKEAGLPVISLVTFLLAFLFLIAGNQINSLVANFFQTSFVEIRPSLNATNQILIESVKDNPVFGVGPTNFEQAWIQYKPEGFNLTELWNVNFRYGYNFLMSFFVMGGLVHIASWLIFLGTYLFFGFKSLFNKKIKGDSRFILIASFI